ncbi:MAG: ABC transporter ATP-binding protein [Candidatus Nitrosocosmicus sp.]
MVLELVNVTKDFPGFRLGPLNLKIEDDSILVITGPTGSGKTTILNLIVGLIKPDSGSIIIDGADITNLPVESRNMGYSFQNPCLFPNMKVFENIVFGLKKEDKKKKDFKIKRLFESLGILHLLDRHIQGLSGGEMQKISIARMLITEPKIMLMDEPLAHLDDQTKRNVRVDLRRILKEQRVSGIYVTHFEDDVYALADSILVLNKGFIERTDTLGSILSYSNQSPSPFLYEIFKGGNNYLEGRVAASKNGVTTFIIGSHKIETLGEYPIDSTVGVLIRPEDIIISLDLVKTSARNVIKTKITRIVGSYLKTGVIDVHLIMDGIHLICRITNESRIYLGIKEGDYVYALFKATSLHIIRDGN